MFDRTKDVRARCARVSCLAVAIAVAGAAWQSRAHAQQPGTIEGVVTASEGLAPLAGVYVAIEGTSRGATTDDAGQYTISGLAAGEAVVVARYLGRRAGRRTVHVTAGGTARADFRLAVEAVEVGELVVSASHEAQRRTETPASIGVVTADALQATRPAHPSDVMNRVAGVWVNVTAGEGHTTAIRQPRTTTPVYLFAQDGVPTRSTGFFNHNALYEVSLPQADRIEVVKGPMSALYGSDAIGGVVNVLTRPPGGESSGGVTVEGGAWEFGRVLAEATLAGERDAVRAEINVTRTAGWRDATGYDRETATLRWDRHSNGSTLSTVATVSRIDQGTAGSSGISRDDFRDAPELNYTPISYRRTWAVRLYSAYENVAGDALWSVTPFVRWNRMEILPDWTLAFDPGVWETGHSSIGALLKYRRELPSLRARVILGTDVDYSPGHHLERAIVPARDGRVFTSYTVGAPLYDYDVRFAGISPWVQAEAAPADALRLVAGLRFDRVAYRYDNGLGELTSGPHRRPASTSVAYHQLSPKLGATLRAADWLHLYAAYGRGFRAPSEGQLFRQGRADNTIGLRPVIADNAEAGARGTIAGRIDYELAVYRMTKRNDILNLTNADGSTETANAGETLHRGVELTAGVALAANVHIDVAWSRSRHTYERWRPRPGLSFSGNEMEDAPRDLVNVVASWRPAALGHDGGLSLEWRRVGSYWMDAANTHRYPGHDLLHARLGVRVTDRALLFARVMNAGDERYAESAAFTPARGEELAPGLPRALYIGVEVGS